jgi:DNA-directed RNA polymerase specialized sigma24 family protein
MTIDPHLLERARRMDRSALAGLLAQMYPLAHRLAHALAGREDVGRGTARFVISHAIRQVRQFRDAPSAQRWCSHFTILTARRAQAHPPDGRGDTLLQDVSADDAPYVAFIHALRDLSQQQREAFLLTHGEAYDLRRLAMAMDCSTHAAQQHLDAANAMMKSLAGESFAGLASRMAEAYQRLTPSEELVRQRLDGTIAAALWKRRMKRIVQLGGLLLLLAAIAYLFRSAIADFFS